MITGYYDLFHHEAVQDFFRLQARKSKAPAQLIIGPWTHGSSNRTKTQDMDFGPASVMNVQKLNLEWFDRYLKGNPFQHPVVRFFVMGENKWREADAWPPAGAKLAPLYLRAGKTAAVIAPQAQEGSSELTSDPANPVPSVPRDRRDVNRTALWSPLDYTEITNQKGVLTWTTAPLSNSLVFAGPIRANLWVEADTVDADWVVRLFAVPPEGLDVPLAHGIVRGSFRNSLVRPSPLIPGQRYKIDVDLGSSAASLPAGYRLRVEVAGSSFPLYGRNTNTAEGPFSGKTARSRQQVYHQRGQESAILLPVLPK